MAVIPTEVIYDQVLFIQSRRTRQLRRWNAIATGNIIEMYMWVESTSFNHKYFNVRMNGVNLFSFAERFLITSSVFYASKTGLSIPVVIGADMSFDLVQMGFGRIFTPITFLMRTEET